MLAFADLRSAAASAQVGDSLDFSDGRAVHIARALSELLELADGLLAGNRKSLSLSEALSLLDSRSIAASRLLSQVLAFSDQHALAVAAQLSDALELIELKSAAAARIISENLNLADARAIAVARQLAEAFGLEDNLVGVLSSLIHTISTLSPLQLSGFLDALQLGACMDDLLLDIYQN